MLKKVKSPSDTEKLYYQEIGRRLKDARIAARRRQRDLADLLGLERTSIPTIEAGKQRLTLYVAKMFHDVLKVDVFTMPCNIYNEAKKEKEVTMLSKFSTMEEIEQHRVMKLVDAFLDS